MTLFVVWTWMKTTQSLEGKEQYTYKLKRYHRIHFI